MVLVWRGGHWSVCDGGGAGGGTDAGGSRGDRSFFAADFAGSDGGDRDGDEIHGWPKPRRAAGGGVGRGIDSTSTMAAGGSDFAGVFVAAGSVGTVASAGIGISGIAARSTS